MQKLYSKKGQTLGITLVSVVFFFIIGMVVLNFILPEIDRTRVDLNCSDASSITDGTKLLCLVCDLTVIYWIILVFSVILGAITSHFLI